MQVEVKNLCEGLDSLADAVENGWSDDRPLNEAFGWGHPAINRKELASIPRRLSSKIKEVNPIIEDESVVQLIDDILDRCETIKNISLPYFYNGNGYQSIPGYLTTMVWVESCIQPLISWTISNDSRVMPQNVSRRLKGLIAKINEMEIDHDKLSGQIKLINEATETAESLPADLQDLKEARKRIESISSEAIKLSSKISLSKDNVEELVGIIKNNKIETDKLVENCEEAYRITTSKGLAGAFDQRAEKLENSMWIWVVGLLASLWSAWYIGSSRIEVLTAAISNTEPKWGMVLTHFLLAVVSLGAPLWFAWISTKQIGQRFKLAEDYGYKASVAKAYEGYRKEAARIDEELEARLFESALSRVEEAPLRLVDDVGYSSPWHELADSSAFKTALKNFPDLRDKVFELAGSIIESTKKSENNAVSKLSSLNKQDSVNE
ncbi:hypothetical protein ACJW8F_16200 [Plesiomonas shigelloides]|uniref:hypothetical protein n=1 Tax=Plesiomonas shigelloides TaxID=703 RepID=UPI00387F1E54